MNSSAASAPASAVAFDRRSGAESTATTSSRSRTTPLWFVVAVLVEFYALLIALRMMVGDVLSVVHVGRRFLELGHTSAAISAIPRWDSPIGYDGQFYYFLAIDPVRAHEYMGQFAGYVYSRPLYPALSSLLGLGRPGAVAYSMLALNVAAVLGGTLALAAWLRRHGRSPWFALLYGTSPAVVFSVFHDLTEPLAYGLVILAVVVFEPGRRGRVLASAGLFALAVLTRETTAVFAAICAIALLCGWPEARLRHVKEARRWLVASAFLAAAVAPLFVWRAFLAVWLDHRTQERPGDLFALLTPFNAIAVRWPWNASSIIVFAAVVVPTVVAVAVVAARLVHNRSQLLLGGGFLAVNAACFVVFVPEPITIDYGAAGRAAIGVLVAALFCIPFLGRSRYSRAAIASIAFSWSLLWFAIVTLVVGESPLSVIA